MKYVLGGIVGAVLGWLCTASYYDKPNYVLTEMSPPPLKTMTAYQYGPYLAITAKPGFWVLHPDQLADVQADEAKWRKPFDLNAADHP